MYFFIILFVLATDYAHATRMGGWTPWSPCSASCGGGIQTRSRSSNVSNAYSSFLVCSNLQDFVKVTIDVVQCCNNRACSANGTWGEWTSWSGCSASCGEGAIRTRVRSCNNPRPQGNGLQCLSPTTGNRLVFEDETQGCVWRSCKKVNGDWGEWTSWGACSASSGGRKRNRIRSCDDPSPMGAGVACLNSNGGRALTEEISQPCKNQTFPVTFKSSMINGSWGEWSSWARCSASCGGGKRNRSRSCNNPNPVGGGLACLDSNGSRSRSEEISQICKNQTCPATTVAPTQSSPTREPVVGKNLAIGKMAKQSSTRGSYVARNAVDGNLKTATLTNSAIAWWSVDLGKPARIYKVRLYSFGNNFNEFKDTNVMIGKNENITQMTLCGTFVPKDKTRRHGKYDSYDVSCGKGLTGRFVLVNKTTDSGNVLAMREFQVYGKYV